MVMNAGVRLWGGGRKILLFYGCLNKKRLKSLRNLDFSPCSFLGGGEGEIRTLGGSFPPQPLSRRSISATHALLRKCFFGGGGRIRTHEAVTLNGFQDRRLQPLGHSSKINHGVISLWLEQVNTRNKKLDTRNKICKIGRGTGTHFLSLVSCLLFLVDIETA